MRLLAALPLLVGGQLARNALAGVGELVDRLVQAQSLGLPPRA
jgi:hypothetical protein